jgi:hypothetical protein
MQIAPGARPGPPIGQLLVCENSNEYAPPIPMELIMSGAVPVLDNVTALAALLIPTFWLPNDRKVGVTVATGAAPVLLKLAVTAIGEFIVTEAGLPVLLIEPLQ